MALRKSGRPRGLLHQLWFHNPRTAGADASPVELSGTRWRTLSLDWGAPQEGRTDPGVRARARRGASARSRQTFLPRKSDELLGRLVERDNTSARRDALPGTTPGS